MSLAFRTSSKDRTDDSSPTSTGLDDIHIAMRGKFGATLKEAMHADAVRIPTLQPSAMAIAPSLIPIRCLQRWEMQ